MDEKQIVGLITSDYSWEQIIYQIVAWEGLDPWNLDLKMLSADFLRYISKMKELNFRIPAKYIIISSVLLRMKSDHLRLLDYLQAMNGADEPVMEDGVDAVAPANGESFALNAIILPQKRSPRRKITISELIDALQKAMRTEEKRERRRQRRHDIRITQQEDLTQRIENLYQRIAELLGRLHDREMTFSELVGTWERKNVISTFLPLVYLDHHQKVRCRQEKMFDEIYIAKR